MSRLKELHPISNKTLASKTTEALRNAILDGTFPPGERIIENDIASELSVSRATLREAFRTLADQGLIVIRPRGGTYVVDLSEADIIEICEVRLALETLAARKLCQSITREQIDYFRKILREMRNPEISKSDVAIIYDLDMQFHEALCRFSNNKRLWHAWTRIEGPLRNYFVFVGIEDSLDIDESAKRHEEILNAIYSSDEDLVQKVIEEHIRNTLTLIKRDNPSRL